MTKKKWASPIVNLTALLSLALVFTLQGSVSLPFSPAGSRAPQRAPVALAQGSGEGASTAPCPDFFFQDPLPVCDWPIVAAADDLAAWAVTNGGLIVNTTDGKNWEYQWSDAQKQPDPPPLRDVCAVGPQVAWICGDGGTVLVTEDGGANWAARNVSVPDPGFQLLGISALDAETAWVVGEFGSVFHTSNGGLDWTSCPLSVNNTLYGVSALSDQVAWVSGDMLLAAYTTDGGAGWQRVDPEADRVGAMRRIKAFDAQNAYAVAECGYFFRTADGGAGWDSVDFGEDMNLFGMSFPGAQRGWISGTDDYEAPFLAVTGDGGLNWAPAAVPELEGERNATAVAFTGGDAVWCCTVDGALARSGNGGADWERLDTVWTRESLWDVQAVDARSAWTVGSDGTILRTFNGGMTWQEQYHDESIELHHLDAYGSSAAWVVGSDGAVLKTEDYGAHWTPQDTGVEGDFDHVAAVGKSEAWISGMDGDGGVLLRTTDGGATWQRKVTLPGCSLGAVSALDAAGTPKVWFGSVEGGEAYVSNTTDGGETWQKSVLPKPEPGVEPVCVTHIHPLEGNRCLALLVAQVGVNTLVLMYRSDDGGAGWAWVTGTAYEAQSFFNIATVDGEELWACGAVPDPYSEPTTLFHSFDGGDNWSHGKNFRRTVLFDVDSADGKAAWLVGYISAIQRSVCPSLFSISPDQAPNTGPVEITDLAGSYFWEGMEVWLEKDGIIINASSVEVLSPYRATCRFDLTGAAAGSYDVVARNANGMEDRLPAGFTVTSPTKWYLPEGSTGGGASGSFETWIVVENPNQGPAEVGLTYMTPQGEVPGPHARMAGRSRLTVNVGETVPGEWSVSTVVASDVPVTAARATYWSAAGDYRRCAHGSIGTSALSRDWYLAEGSTGGGASGSFETWIAVQNPGDAPARVEVTYLTPGGAVPGPVLAMKPRSRANLNVGDTVPGEWSVSTRLVSDVPVAAERATYWSGYGGGSGGGALGGPFRQAGTSSLGATGASRYWYFAEGSTGSDAAGGFETWIVLANPYEHTVQAKLDYCLPEGRVAGPELTVAPLSRVSVNVADTLPGRFEVATEVSADGPVVAERAVYWNAPAVRFQAAQASLGASSPARKWDLPEGSTGSGAAGGFETWLVLQNPGDAPARVEVTFMTPGGAVPGPVVVMGPHSRRNVLVSATVPDEWSVSTRVSSDRPVTAEWAVYWSSPGRPRKAAEGSLGWPPSSW